MIIQPVANLLDHLGRSRQAIIPFSEPEDFPVLTQFANKVALGSLFWLWGEGALRSKGLVNLRGE